MFSIFEKSSFKAVKQGIISIIQVYVNVVASSVSVRYMYVHDCFCNDDLSIISYIIEK